MAALDDDNKLSGNYPVDVNVLPLKDFNFFSSTTGTNLRSSQVGFL